MYWSVKFIMDKFQKTKRTFVRGKYKIQGEELWCGDLGLGCTSEGKGNFEKSLTLKLSKYISALGLITQHYTYHSLEIQEPM